MDTDPQFFSVPNSPDFSWHGTKGARFMDFPLAGGPDDAPAFLQLSPADAVRFATQILAQVADNVIL